MIGEQTRRQSKLKENEYGQAFWNTISNGGNVEHLEQCHKHTFLSGLMANEFSTSSVIVTSTWQPHNFTATSKDVARTTIAQDVPSWPKNS